MCFRRCTVQTYLDSSDAGLAKLLGHSGSHQSSIGCDCAQHAAVVGSFNRVVEVGPQQRFASREGHYGYAGVGYVVYHVESLGSRQFWV